MPDCGVRDAARRSEATQLRATPEDCRTSVQQTIALLGVATHLACSVEGNLGDEEASVLDDLAADLEGVWQGGEEQRDRQEVVTELADGCSRLADAVETNER